MEKEIFSKYEKARMLGARALQISMGAPILIKTDITDPTEIAVAEFKKRIVPMTVVRRAPGQAPITVNIGETDLEEMLF